MSDTATTNPFKAGDHALHINNQLDSRPVVEVNGDQIVLQIGETRISVRAEDYTVIPGASDE